MNGPAFPVSAVTAEGRAMHCKALRSEYMKRFRDPEWEACRSCYEEMLKYRLGRRMLEHAHNPWLWDGWDGSSGSSSGHSTPPTNLCEPKALERGQPSYTPAPAKQPEGTAGPRAPCSPAAERSGDDPLSQENNQDGEKNTESNEKSASLLRAQHSRSLPSKQNVRKSDASPQRMSLTKEIQHPFALYASGEKKKDTGSQKTHNVCAPALENEIHESALRAKNRRQKERKKHLLQKQRAHSADAERVLRRKPSPVDNPWMTEYMRCFSARAR
ncbi:centriole, cilia and spindle-associated protein isoform 2-T6 [Anomaloglossus baeobatrachus]|uniref:centriole, cilia and spindle-associated protein isoform X1 n=2 Tax=Anomaloglossus baeobatrachus TaxID=238106 RepID=UPI003F4FCB11